MSKKARRKAQNKMRVPDQNKAEQPLPEPIKAPCAGDVDADPAWREAGLWKLVIPLEERADG